MIDLNFSGSSECGLLTAPDEWNRSQGKFGRTFVMHGFSWRLALLVTLPLLATIGCSETDATQDIADDEAMQRAKAEDTRIEVAANTNFYPKLVYDYFEGMDSISVRTGDGDDLPDPLLDKLGQNNGDDADATRAKIVESRTVESPELTRSETLGRNTWMIWCAGNEGFWDWLATDSLGFIDLLKLLDSRGRNERFRIGGLINEPEMGQAIQPAPEDFGLWLDTPRDPQIRAWREAYLTKTFQAIAEGKHKSQIGLKKHSYYYDRESGQDLYVGDVKAFKHKGYDYPSSYLSAGDHGITKSPSDNEYGSSFYDERIPPPDIYGISSGVIGLRLFPNPNFDSEAQRRWDAKRYYTDQSYYSDPNLVRPYRVGVSCAYCHASYHPLLPPQSVVDPEWANISGSIGAQYLRIRVAFSNLLTKDQFTYHLLDSQPPGTIDTSLIASDSINNPNTMNAVFNLPARSFLSFRNPKEKLSPASETLPSYFAGPDPGAPPTDEYYDDERFEQEKDWRVEFAKQGLSEDLAESNGNPRHTPRVLLDGSDSIGPVGALARVYLNIGSYWERWNQLHEPVIGFREQGVFRLRDCETHSVYWNATVLRVGGLRDYFLKVTPPMPLLSTPNAQERLKPVDITDLGADATREERLAATKVQRARKIDVSRLGHGRKVFARNCIVCHSSIQPESSAVTLFDLPDEPSTSAQDSAEGAESVRRSMQQQDDYNDKYADLIERRKQEREEDAARGKFFERDPGGWLRDPDYQKWALEIVEEPEFWKQNYLSTDYRVPITLVQTNAGRAMATNALTGHMWEDFASESYRTLPSPGPIEYFNPYKGKDGETDQFMPQHKTPQGAPEMGGGIGYYRVPTLISIWATAPLLHNNSLGVFNNDPSVDGRLDAFDDAIRKLLWVEKRLESSSYNEATAERLKADHGLIWRTTEETSLTIDAKRVPFFATRLPFVTRLHIKYPWLRSISPLWLPSAILLSGSLLILLLSNSQWARKVGLTLVLSAAVLLLLFLAAERYPNHRWLNLLRTIQPAWLVCAAIAALAIPLLLPLSAKWRRWVGYFSTAAALAIGAVVYFNAGKLGALTIGPIPKGTPVNLLANFNPDADRSQQFDSLRRAVDGFTEIKSRHLQGADADSVMKKKIAPALLEVNKCPDFVMDKGHYYDWFHSMSDDDKEALVELLKTF